MARRLSTVCFNLYTFIIDYLNIFFGNMISNVSELVRIMDIVGIWPFLDLAAPLFLLILKFISYFSNIYNVPGLSN